MHDQYIHTVPGLGITFIADRLRRDHYELIGELRVECQLPGARTVNGVLNIGDFNFSSVRARQDRAKLLAQRAETDGAVDWFLMLEDFAQRVFEAERAGDPAVDLASLPLPVRGDELRIDGLVFPRRHASVIFGDGGSAKSYTALYGGGRLSQQGLSVALFDWELSGEDHRLRLELIFGVAMPRIRYCRCERPLVAEVDRLRRIVRDDKIDYAVFDSIAFACDGPPEAAEVAGRYFRAVRELEIGSLHIAHITKTGDGNDQRPFGSAFWHNGARMTWFVKAAAEDAGSDVLHLGFFNRKSNLAAFSKPAGYIVKFTKDRTLFSPFDPADNPDLAVKLSVREKMRHFLRTGARRVSDIAEEIEAKPETIERTARRYRESFVVLDGGRIGLKGRA